MSAADTPTGRDLDIAVAEEVLGYRRIGGPRHDYYGPCEYGDVLIPPDLSDDEAFSMMPPTGAIGLGHFVRRFSDDERAHDRLKWAVLQRGWGVVTHEGVGVSVEGRSCVAAVRLFCANGWLFDVTAGSDTVYEAFARAALLGARAQKAKMTAKKRDADGRES